MTRHCPKCGAKIVEYDRRRARYDTLTGAPEYRVWLRCPNAWLPQWIGRRAGFVLSELFPVDHAWRDDYDRREASDAWNAEWAAAFAGGMVGNGPPPPDAGEGDAE